MIWILVIAAIPLAAAVIVVVDSIRLQRRTEEEKQQRALDAVNREAAERSERVRSHISAQELKRIRHLYHQ